VDDRTWYLGLFVLSLAFAGMVLDAALPGFNVDAGFYPFLGIFAGAAFGVGVVRGVRERKRNGNGNGNADKQA